LAATDKTNGLHTRIIWSCEWSHDNKYFATASRDGKVAIWTWKSEEKDNENNKLKGWCSLKVLERKNESLTAVTFAPNTLSSGEYLLAVGNENGFIFIYKFDNDWTLLSTLKNS